MALSPGQIINGKYRVLRLLGDGGMGAVYEAFHEVLSTKVALKLLHAELSRTGVVKRFLQEARASARITSPHVVRVLDADQTPDGMAFIVLEYLEGKTLRETYEVLVREGRLLPYGDALDFAMQMFAGVEAAHAAGIVHRDLKPDNVMITVDAKGAPLLKLLDFGIAKMDEPTETSLPALTRPGALLGTPEYMAPEQVYSAGSADARSDVFSLGVILFEMLSGHRPVVADDPQQIAVSYLTGAFTRLEEVYPEVPPGLADAVHRAIAAQPRDRFASVAEMRAAIEPFAPPRPGGPGRFSTADTAAAIPPPPSSSSTSRQIPETRSYPEQQVEGAIVQAVAAPVSAAGAPVMTGDRPLPSGTTLMPQVAAGPSPTFAPVPAVAATVGPGMVAAVPPTVSPGANGAAARASFVPEYPSAAAGWPPPAAARASQVPMRRRRSVWLWVGVAAVSLVIAIAITLGVLDYLGWLDDDPPARPHRAVPAKPHPTAAPAPTHRPGTTLR